MNVLPGSVISTAYVDNASRKPAYGDRLPEEENQGSREPYETISKPQTVAEYIPAYPDDTELQQYRERQNQNESTNNFSKTFMAFSSDMPDTNSKGRFVDITV
ncbi:MAG: hypothetical protein CMI08_06225 [Oceanospirillaceae bacterium]|uniref:hypothetical protein n=1 Tax=unclassified Thalassolituus TaxID=2624967 RepID=UPI000C0B5900|nr:MULTISPECIES: hypothetical protein [unclassified Thalassolituus]MAK91072.1 hypothetical protein [Thalassolituus sp.]MAS25640.1 hypothetical protein [Oceanospirillaceae bacterium]MAX98792.1 hypothetical protein [Oceanospirillaceae bacterium]MBL35700.1 hypothetical protein [Oceanospirillaceae bacterium]MBS52229.1 hypothetical protein [Oceanospirillaceae bacterium]|tara:strand:- start:257 stop:565 length:309 start_codon:yes stop_codon:yes gene_type:complete